MSLNNYPRIVIGGLAGDSGKTIVSCSLLACLKERGVNIAAFKKGPDYIDAAWLSLFSGKPARNLDTYMMGFHKVKNSFIENAVVDGINIIEGNRGLFDGGDLAGTHSTAEVAKLIQSPVIIILNISKVTRTAAASILGCMKIDSELNIEGVILNQCAGERHKNIVKHAIEDITGVPVIGVIPKLPDNCILPPRYFGLITPEEFEGCFSLLQTMRKEIEDYVDIECLIKIAQKASFISKEDIEENESKECHKRDVIKIGIFRDRSFSFYYPENLEILSKMGAELVPISPAEQSKLDDIDALYIGGGFPETNIIKLSSNKEFIESLKRIIERGLPVYAECGGLMYLAKEIICKGKEFKMAGVLPISVRMYEKPQGHGYCEMIVDSGNPFYKEGTVIKGHEFHYSKIIEPIPEQKTCFSVSKGTGCYHKRDGLIYKNVLASYIHIHALAVPEWADGIFNKANQFKTQKSLEFV